MKIGFDAKRVFRNWTGLGNYSRLVIQSLATTYPEDTLLLFAEEFTGKDSKRINEILSLPNIKTERPSKKGFSGKGPLWRPYGITRQLRSSGIDIFHGLSNELPLNIKESKIPSIVTIHDVIFRRLDYAHNTIDRKIYDYKYGHSARNATRVIAVSERTKADIMEFYGVPEERIDVVYQGCDPQFSQRLSDDERLRNRRELQLPERFLTQVGTVERRKNLELSIRALPYVPKDIELVVLGGDSRGYKKEMEELAGRLGVFDRIIFREGIPFTKLPAVYQLAEISLYPSHYEGFGIPVLESVTGGTPVIAATGSCLEEAGGDAAIYVDPHSPREMAEAINHLLEDTDDRGRRILRGLEWSRRFDMTKIGENVHAVYDKALRSGRSRK